RRGVPRCASAQRAIASRCASPRGPRGPERSSSAVTAYVPGSLVGDGVGVTETRGAAVHEASASARRIARSTWGLGAGAAGDAFLRVDVLEEILGPRVGGGLG